MEAILLGILLTIVLVSLAFVATVGVFSWQLNRSNRVDPEVATPAPILWLWSPTQPAKLHRRLRGAVRPLVVPTRRGRKAPPLPPHAELGRTVSSQAVAIDRQIVAVSRTSRQNRRRQLHAITPHVVEIERLSLRLVHQQRMATQPANIGGPHRHAPSTVEVLTDVGSRLDRLDEAHHELVAIERDNGLLDPDEVMAQVATPPPAPVPLERSPNAVATPQPRSTPT